MPRGSPPYALCSRLLVAGFAFGLVWNFNDVNFGVGPPESPTTVPMAGQLDSSKLLRRRQKLSSRRGGGIGGTALQWAVCPPCPESAVAGSPDIASREAYANKTWARTSSFSSAGWSPATVTVTVCVVGFQRVRACHRTRSSPIRRPLRCRRPPLARCASLRPLGLKLRGTCC